MTTQHIPDTAAGPAPSPAPGYPPDVEADLLADIGRITSRYPQGHERSALIPMLHLIQSVDGCVSPYDAATKANAKVLVDGKSSGAEVGTTGNLS